MKEQMNKIDTELLLNRGKFRGMWILMKGYQPLYIFAIVSLAIGAIARAGALLVIRHIVDKVFPLPNIMEVIVFFIAIFTCLAGIEAFFTFLQRKLTAGAAEGTIRRLRNFLFNHVQRLPFTYHDHTDTGDILERVTSDVETLHRFYSEQAIEIGRIIALFGFSLAAIFSITPFLGILSVICLPFIIFQALWFFKRIEASFSKLQDQEAVISTVVQENIAGIRVVQAFSRQDLEIKKFNNESMEKYRRGKKLVFLNASFWPISDIICFIQTFLIYIMGGWMVIRGELSLGSFIALMGLIIWAVWPLRDLGRIIIQASSGTVSYSRILHILKEKPELSDRPMIRESTTAGKAVPHTRQKKSTPGRISSTPGRIHSTPDRIHSTPDRIHSTPDRIHSNPGRIQFRDVCFSYKEGEPVLDHITFSCLPGQRVAIVGQTGSGKSSLVQLIPGFYPYTKGSIHIDGRELSTIPLHTLRMMIGVVEQEPFLFSRTIKENIAYGIEDVITGDEINEKRITLNEIPQDTFPGIHNAGSDSSVDSTIMDRIIKAASAAAIHEVIMEFPNQYDTIIGEKGTTLSGGQRQRIAIARTILKNPSILILDDATSSVDMGTEALINKALNKLMEGRTCFIIAHRVETVMRADIILVLDKGKIIQKGPHHSLIREPGIYRKIFYHQLTGEFVA